jgi:hypothetical protein
MIFRLSLLVSAVFLIAPWTGTGSWTGNPDNERAPRGESLKIKQIQEKYLSIHDSAISADAFRYGMIGYEQLLSAGNVSNDSLLTLIDFSRPSAIERFFVINLNRNMVIYKSLVSHGRNSGELYASSFSNKIHSHQSALGFYITGEPYSGSQGYSLGLNGLDTGYNDLSRIRAIVIHGAGYATREYVHRYGRLGRSFGCPALPPSINKRVIDAIKGGSVVFGYFPDQTYLQNSVVLNWNGRRP